jgi:hypothetical protein
MMSGQQTIADYIFKQAAWRDTQAAEPPDQRRNERAAASLRELAAYVLALPGDDERILELTRLVVRDGAFLPFPEGERVIAVFGFDSVGQDCGTFLTQLLRLTGGFARAT